MKRILILGFFFALAGFAVAAGWILFQPKVTMHHPDFGKDCVDLRDAATENAVDCVRVFYGTNLANGIGIQSFYMTYGGTSWGWLPAPVVFTSYDYGAAISEPRALRDKAQEMKQLGGLIASVPEGAADQLRAIPGSVPPPHDMPPGCRFAPRCDHALPQCTSRVPETSHPEASRSSRCIRWKEVC